MVKVTEKHLVNKILRLKWSKVWVMRFVVKEAYGPLSWSPPMFKRGLT